MGKADKEQSRASFGDSIGGAIGGAIDGALGTVGALGKMLTDAVLLPGMRGPGAAGESRQPGARPGIEHMADVNTPPAPGQVTIRCIDYGPERVESVEVNDLGAFLDQPRPDWCTVRWINVDGLHPFVVNRFRQAFDLHTLAAEDVMNVPQRPKLETYDDDLFIVGRMIRLIDHQLQAKQVSFFVSPGRLVTFQESAGDVWQPIRDRIETAGSRLRTHGVDYLIYALLDAMVDHCFPILEHYGERLEQMEGVTAQRPTPALLQRIHSIKRELVLLRRVIWPMRDVVNDLYRDEHDIITDTGRTYLRDVYDHAVQIIDLVETYREMSSGLTDLYMSAVSNRMNEVMKVLTIMASLFIPITFLAGVYGMNFEHIPETKWAWAYPVFWVICLAMVVGLLIFFRRRGWIGRS